MIDQVLSRNGNAIFVEWKKQLTEEFWRSRALGMGVRLAGGTRRIARIARTAAHDGRLGAERNE